MQAQGNAQTLRAELEKQGLTQEQIQAQRLDMLAQYAAREGGSAAG